MQKSNQKQQFFFIACLIIIAAAEAYYIAACTAIAPWGYSDTAVYYASARNLANGTGLGVVNPDRSFTRLTVFAPFFSIVLSLFARPGIDLIAANRILEILFYSVLIISSGWLFYRISSSRVMGVFLSLLIAGNYVFANIFTSMMSEPLAFVLAVPGFLLVILAIQEQSRKHLILAGILSGLAFLTRYAFVAIPITGVVVLLLLSKTNWGKRIIDTLIYSLLGFLPMAFFLVPQFINSHSIDSRTMTFSSSLNERVFSLFSGIYNVIKFWFPYRTNMIPGIQPNVFRPILFCVFALVIFCTCILAWQNKLTTTEQKSFWLLFNASVIYLIIYFLVFSAVYLFTSASIPIYDRLLSPLLPGIYLVLLGAAGIVDQRILHLKFSIPVTGLFITLFFVVFNFSPLQTYLLHSSSPEGYTSPLWKGQPIFDRIAKIPDSTPILSNAPDIILFYTNKDGYFLTPRPKSASSFISVNDLSKIQDIIDTQCGIIALFDPINADSIENKHEFLDAQQVASLKARYVPIYSGKDGELLTAKRCIKE